MTLSPAPPSHAFLVVITPEGQARFPLADGTSWRIGRSDDNEVVLKSEVISRCHAMIQRTEESAYYLIDMGSRNGSFVNHARVSVPSALNSGDLISIGDWTLQFEAESPLSAAIPAPRNMDATTKTLFAWSKISVMVIDIRDFTGLTQRLEESILCQLIGTWFRKGGEILSDHGCWGQKYIGDAMMSVWLHEEGKEQQEVRNILLALTKLVDMTVGLQAQFELSESIRVGAGLNTGYATLGNAGSEHMTDHTALGDTVNATFRFESASKEAEVDLVIGNDTYTALCGGVSPGMSFRALTVTLKGYAAPWSVWGTGFEELRNLR